MLPPARSAAPSLPEAGPPTPPPDESASWDAALELYYAELCECALRLVGSAEAAQDVVHDLFLHLWDTRGPRDVVRLTRPYLYAAVRNQALKSLRRRRVAEAWIARVSREEAAAAESPCDVYLCGELEDMIERALAELPPRCREIFLLRRRDQLSYEEIAASLGVSLGTVKSQMWRAAVMLKERLAPYLAAALSVIVAVVK